MITDSNGQPYVVFPLRERRRALGPVRDRARRASRHRHAEPKGSTGAQRRGPSRAAAAPSGVSGRRAARPRRRAHVGQAAQVHADS